MRNYTRWRDNNGVLHADILGSRLPITANPTHGTVSIAGQQLTPDEARMHGVRLTEAAALADGERAIRRAPAITTAA